MSADGSTMNTVAIGGGAINSASLRAVMKGSGCTVSMLPQVLKVQRGARAGRTPEAGNGLIQSARAVRAWTVATLSRLNAWTGIIVLEKSSCSQFAKTSVGRRLPSSPKSLSAISCAPTVTGSEPQEEHAKKFFPKKSSVLPADLAGSLDKHSFDVGHAGRQPADVDDKFSPRGKLPFGAFNGPGLVYDSRKHRRSCRCVLARLLCGCTSVLAHTKEQVRRTRLMVADTCCACLVSGSPRQLLDGEFGLASALSRLLCGIRTLARSFDGSDVNRPLVT